MSRVVIVGSGICGMEAALALRNREPGTPIALVSDEHDHFFSRPALMYVFAGQMTVRDTEPYDRELFGGMGFERVRGRVTRRGSRRPGNWPSRPAAAVGYDRLLLAVGSKAPARSLAGGGGSRRVTTSSPCATSRGSMPRRGRGRGRWSSAAGSSAWRRRRSSPTAGCTSPS